MAGVIVEAQAFARRCGVVVLTGLVGLACVEPACAQQQPQSPQSAQPAAKDSPNADAAAELLHGLNLTVKNDFAGADAAFSKAIAMEPNPRSRAFKLTVRGYFRFADGNREGALADYDQAIRIHPSSHAYTLRVEVWAAKRDYDRVIDDCTQAIRLSDARDDISGVLRRRGEAWFEKKDYTRAIADFDQGIQRKPDDAVLRRGRGRARYVMRDFDGAIADLSEAIRIDPKFTDAYNERGNARFQKNDIGGAIADYTAALELNPNDAMVIANRGWAHIQKGENEAAFQDAQSAIHRSPKLASAYRTRGYALMAFNRPDEAAASFRTALALNPSPTVKASVEQALKRLQHR